MAAVDLNQIRRQMMEVEQKRSAAAEAERVRIAAETAARREMHEAEVKLAALRRAEREGMQEQLAGVIDRIATENAAAFNAELSRLMSIAAETQQKLKGVLAEIDATYKRHAAKVDEFARLAQTDVNIEYEAKFREYVQSLGQDRAQNKASSETTAMIRQKVSKLAPAMSRYEVCGSLVAQAAPGDEKRMAQAIVYFLTGDLIDPPEGWRAKGRISDLWSL